MASIGRLRVPANTSRHGAASVLGRQLERQLLLTTIGSSASSRQAVAGDAQAEGYWSSDEIIPISAEGTSEQLLGQLLSGAYDPVLANCPSAAGPEVAAA